MIAVTLDAGASKAGLTVIRATRESRGVRFRCLRHEHMDLMLDGGEREELAVSALLSLLEWTLTIREGDEPIVVVVEGVEGYVYKGRSTTHLFDTADQAGGIRLCVRTWRRLRGVSGITVKRTTASVVRRFLFGRTRAGDNEVVLAVRACVSGMPPLRVPVPDERTKEGKAIHAYDAGAVGLVAAAEAMGMTRLVLPDSALTEILKYRAEDAAKEARKTAEKAASEWLEKAGGEQPVPRRDSRHTRRRRSEAATAAAARRT